MAVLESCPKHNMVAYLEKTNGNAEFYEIIDFLARSSIHNALTVSLVVSTTFVEQFWMSAKSKIINNVRYITAKVAGKPVSISEASIRSDLLFDDTVGIDSLPNHAIFDAIQLMGYEGDLTVLTFNKALHLDAKKKFVMYPRFISVFLDTQLKSVPVPLDYFPVNALTKSSQWDLEVTDQAKEIKQLKAQIKKLKKKAKPGRKPSKAEPSVHKDPLFDELADDTLDYMDTKNAQDMGRSKVSTDRSRVSTDKEEVSTDRPDEGIDDQTEGRSATPTTQTPTLTTFGVDENYCYSFSNEKKKIEEEDESDTKSEGIPEAEKKFNQLARDEEMLERLRDFKIEKRAVHCGRESKVLCDTIALQRRSKSLIRRVDKEDGCEETPKKEDTAKVPAKVDVTEQGTKKRKGGHIKMLVRKRKRPQSDVESDDEHIKCLKIVTFEGTIDSEIMERKSIIARLNKVSLPDGDYLVIYKANRNFRAFNCLLEVLHIFDRQDLFHLYDLVMEQYSEITLEGSELILWGDLKIMMESSQEEKCSMCLFGIKGRVPLHLSSSAGDSNGTYHRDEKEPYIEKFVVEE
ncbi:hypothetical protein Tco_0462069 [Tanacetum coccineum]